ncbi:MAG: LamG-like jellyroll fold domain-containing protein, partial [Candidatus Poseidoniaceae archaeon]
RFDAPIGEVGEGRNGTMHHNVIWNAAGGLMVKGDYHDIHNNTVFNSTGKNDIIFLTDGGINNKNSTLHYNAVDAMADHRSDDVFANPLPNGSHWSNWNGYVQGYDGMFEARNQHTCALYENNSLYCWGRNNYGQLGLGTTSSYEDSPQFVDVGSGLTVESIGISGSGDQASGPKSHTCAVLSNGQLKCWGDNADGQLGLGNVSSAGVWEPTAVNLGAGRTAVDVATANAATCALLDDQSVKCWGRNTRGQLGLGNDSSNDVLTPQLVTFSGSSKPIKLAGALRSFCAIMDNGTMACWGSNDNGELGLGNTTSMVRSPTYLSIHTGRTVVSVDLGKYFTCVSYDNGSVACTGANNVWQLGLGNTTSSSTLQYVADMDVNAYRTDVAQKVGCAHLTNASLVCWGHDEWGLFGYSTNTYSQEFGFTANKYAVFPSGRTVASLSVGFTHACAVLDNGDLACWGNNNMAQLGLGNTSQQWIPVVVSNVSSIRKMAVHEMLVDPANNDFRPAWGSALQVRGAGAYDAGDADPWTAGISWTYTTPSAPVAGCMLDYADNYDADATLSDGSCLFSSYTPPSTLDLRLHLDPTNSSSYSGSGTNVADLSGFNNNGTVASVGPDWIPSRTRFAFDGSCSNNSDGWNSAGTYTCDEIEIEDSTTLRPGEPYEDLALKLNHVFSSTKSLKAPSTTAGYTLGAINTSFTVQVWLQPTDCETATDYQTFLHKEESYSFACKKGFFHYRLGNGTGWPDAWVNTSVNAVDDVWQHVAFTRSGSSNPVNMYLDGVLSFTASSSVDEIGEDNQEPLVVGTNPGDSSGAQRFYGILDDVRIYTSDRSSTIDDDMNVYPNVSDNNLNAYFDFNLERDGDTITSVPNMATGSGASSASLTVVSGSPEVVRTWDVSTVGSETVLTFERTVITAQGGWRVPTGVSSADVLIVGGGGGGGYNTGGGGGGGGVGFYNSTALTAGSSVVVVVGQGGQGSTTSGSSGANGTSSQLGTISVGGGGGGAGWASSGANGADAPTGSPAYDKNGSGGGASNTNGLGGTGATDGGDGANDAGAGGGGAGADGSGASSNSGGDGGNGLTSDITGSSVMYGSGAGGGSWNTYGNGGSGAGNGGTSTAATHGTTNRGGGGGGGGGNSKDGANGGSGVVIVRFASVDHNDWSVATWFNASSEDYGMIVSSLNNGGQAQTMSWFIRRETSSPYGLYAAIGDADSGDSKTTSPKISVDEDRWYHVVMVADMGDTLRLYLDGVNVANTSLSGVSNLRDSSNSVFIGSHNGGEYNQGFDGQVGSVMIFADALNASNINQLYTAGKGVYSNTTNLSYA